MNQISTVADILRPVRAAQAFLYDVALVASGSVILALSARVSFMIPGSVVPVTGQTFAVLFLAALLGRKRGTCAVLAYIAEGVSGMPIFSMGGSGIMWLVGPTGGYLAGFAAAAYVTGFLAERKFDRSFTTSVFAMVLGNIIIHAFGVAWLTVYAGAKSFQIGCLPFLAGDALKIVTAAILLPSGWKLLEKFFPGHISK